MYFWPWNAARRWRNANSWLQEPWNAARRWGNANSWLHEPWNLVLTLTCWRRPELCIRERVKKISHFWPGTHIFLNKALCLYILFAGREVRIGKNCALGLEYGPTLKNCDKFEAAPCAMTEDRWCKWGKKKGEREGWKSFIHFKFRQDFFLSPTMLRYVAMKCCDRLAGALSYSLDKIWVYCASHLLLS